MKRRRHNLGCEEDKYQLDCPPRILMTTQAKFTKLSQADGLRDFLQKSLAGGWLEMTVSRRKVARERHPDASPALSFTKDLKRQNMEVMKSQKFLFTFLLAHQTACWWILSWRVFPPVRCGLIISGRFRQRNCGPCVEGEQEGRRDPTARPIDGRTGGNCASLGVQSR